MNSIKRIITVLVVILFFGCSTENDNLNLESVDKPTNIDALMTIEQDNSGKVTILPSGEGVTQYEIYFGDGTLNPVAIQPGGKVEHIYTEGVYQVKIIGITIDGQRTEVIKELTVSFLSPTNLNVIITPQASLMVDVSATADLETYFQVYFGEDPNQVPVDFMESETVSHTYALAGTYQIRVVALSGGVATTDYTENIIITDLTEAPTPTLPSGNVISMFSDAYTDVNVDTWQTSWSQATLDNISINGNATKRYSALNFVGIETTSSPIDATAMTYFHTDVWSSNFTEFKIKLVDFGANGAFGGGDDVEHEITVTAPAQEQWVSLDIPLSDFTNLTTRGHIAQLIYVAAPSGATTVYLDNVFFYNQSPTPLVAAPTPTFPSGNVVSMFSDAYTDVNIDTWQTSWSQATLEDVLVSGNATKKYSALNFVGIEATSNTIDATAMTHFHTDIWSANFTEFKVKLVDFGANGTFGGGDDVEHEITVTAPDQEQWVSLDIPLSDFTNLTTKGHIAQLIYVAAPSGATTVYVDNVYFHN